MLATNPISYDRLVLMDTELGRTISKLRDDKGWSQRELGRRAGVSNTAISKLESGDAEPTNNTIVRVALALGQDPEELLRLAGHLPSIPPPTDLDTEICQRFRCLSMADKQAVAHIVFSLTGVEAEADLPQAVSAHPPATAEQESGKTILSEAGQQELLAIALTLQEMASDPLFHELMDLMANLRQEGSKARTRMEPHTTPASADDSC